MEPSIRSSSNKRKEHENLQRSLGVCLKWKRYIQWLWYCKQGSWWWVLFCLFVLICSPLHCTYLELPNISINLVLKFIWRNSSSDFRFSVWMTESHCFPPSFAAWLDNPLSPLRIIVHFFVITQDEATLNCFTLINVPTPVCFSSRLWVNDLLPQFFSWFMIDQWIGGLPLYISRLFGTSQWSHAEITTLLVYF